MVLKGEFVYGLDYIDEQVIQYNPSGIKYYMLQDANYNVVAMVGAADGVVHRQYAYYPYGEFQAFENRYGEPTGQMNYGRFFHQGRWLDKEAGNYYNRARYYMTPLGRFNSRDPNEMGVLVVVGARHNAETPTVAVSLNTKAQYTDGMNLYAYVSSSPVSRTDSLGLWGDGKAAFLADLGTDLAGLRKQIGEGTTRQGFDAFVKLREYQQTPLGHSDFSGWPEFDWTHRDKGFTNPINPLTFWIHFKPLSTSDNAATKAIARCDKTDFEEYVHDAQDYYAHYMQGHRWYTAGHAFHGSRPDNSFIFDSEYREAANYTTDRLSRWHAHCKKLPDGSWVVRTPVHLQVRPRRGWVISAAPEEPRE
jgi:RHS repeat-associated protein